MHPIQFCLAAQAVREAPAYYLDQMQSTIFKITILGLMTGWGTNLAKGALNTICDPDACLLTNKGSLLESCLKEKATALVDPSNLPRDWSATPYDSCKNELMPPCDPDVDEGICKMTLSAIDTVESTVEKINSRISEIQSYCSSLVNAILPARGFQFVYNRILHRG